MKHPRDWWVFWPIADFGGKYLHSDLLGNYTRDYTWSANQLGHAALGLAAAFVYFLLGQLNATQMARIYLIGKGRVVLGASGAEIGFHGLMLTLSALFFLVFVALCAWALVSLLRSAWSGPLFAGGLFRLPARLLLLLVFGAALWLAAALARDGFEQRVDLAGVRRLEAAGVLFTTLFFALVVARISRAALYVALGWTALAAAALMSAPYLVDATPLVGVTRWALWPDFAAAARALGLTATPSLFWSATLATLFALLAPWLWRGDGLGRVSFWTPPALAALFCGIVVATPEPGWRAAIAAALASLAVWWVKEFGADLYELEDRLALTAARRIENGYPARFPCGATREQDLERAERDLREDSRCDSRTDALFYLAGATLATGVLGAELPGYPGLPAALGVVFFLGLYVGAGWRWTRRGKALDAIGMRSAGRFAMLDGALDIRVLAPRGGGLAEIAAEQGPTRMLEDFARGALRVGGERIKYLVVAGGHGSGRSRLGRAVACETALCNLPPCGGARRRAAGAPRRAKLLTLRGALVSRLPPAGNRARIVDVRRERQGRPDLFVLDDADPFALDAWDAFAPPSAEDAAAAESALRARRRRVLTEALTELMVDATDQLVLVIGARGLAPAETARDWRPALPPAARAYAEDLAACFLAPPPIAVALVARATPLPED